DRYAEPLGSGQEHVGVRLGMTDLVPRDDRHIGVEFQQLESVLRDFHASASRNRIRHMTCRQRVQELLCARKEAKRCGLPPIRFPMQALDAVGLVLRNQMTDLPKKSL